MKVNIPGRSLNNRSVTHLTKNGDSSCQYVHLTCDFRLAQFFLCYSSYWKGLCRIHGSYVGFTANSHVGLSFSIKAKNKQAKDKAK